MKLITVQEQSQYPNEPNPAIHTVHFITNMNMYEFIKEITNSYIPGTCTFSILNVIDVDEWTREQIDELSNNNMFELYTAITSENNKKEKLLNHELTQEQWDRIPEKYICITTNVYGWRYAHTIEVHPGLHGTWVYPSKLENEYEIYKVDNDPITLDPAIHWKDTLVFRPGYNNDE